MYMLNYCYRDRIKIQRLLILHFCMTSETDFFRVRQTLIL